MNRILERIRWRWLLPATCVAIGILLMISGMGPREIRAVIDASGAASPVAFVGLATLMMCLFVPKTVISLSAGALFGLPMGGIMLSMTAVVSAFVNYTLGRWSLGGAPRVSQSIRDIEVLRQIQVTAATAGFAMHLLVRLMPIPTTMISYAMGMAGARWGPYLAAAAMASVPQWLWVYCGSEAVSAADMAWPRWVGVILSITAAILLSVVVPQKILRRVRAMQAPPDSHSVERS